MAACPEPCSSSRRAGVGLQPGWEATQGYRGALPQNGHPESNRPSQDFLGRAGMHVHEPRDAIGGSQWCHVEVCRYLGV